MENCTTVFSMLSAMQFLCLRLAVSCRLGSGVRSVWLRHNLENFKKCLKALERKASDDESCGEIETAHPGDLGLQDTFYVGNLKGVGHIYQQTFVDTYS